MKKIFATLTLVGFLFLGMTSCGSSEKPAATDTIKAIDTVKVDTTAVKADTTKTVTTVTVTPTK